MNYQKHNFEPKQVLTAQALNEIEDGIIEIENKTNNITPSIGTNGNWFIGNTDTGIKAEGKDGYTPIKGVDYFDGEQGPQGEKGADGISATHTWNGTTLTITSASGISSANLKGEKGDKGEQGIQGEKGADGVKGDKGDTGASGKDGTSVTVASISESTEDGGSNVVTFSDGKTITIKNGSKGNKGDKPQKGVDYFTDADQEAIVQQVITALGTPVFGRVDEGNNIILSGELADGTYTIKYENADGTLVMVGTIDQGIIKYTNVLSTAVDRNGNVYNGVGYINGTYLTGSATEYANDPLIKSDAKCFSTGFLPYTYNDVANKVPIYIKGVDLSDSVVAENGHHFRFAIYNSLTESAPRGGSISFLTHDTVVQRFGCSQLGEKYYMICPSDYTKRYGDWQNNSSEAPYARLSLPGTGEGVIITINEPIE